MAELWHVEHGPHESLEDADLRAEPQREQHREEEERPERRPRQLREDVRHHDEGEAGALRRVVQLGRQAAVFEAVLRREVFRQQPGGHDAVVLLLGYVVRARVVQALQICYHDGEVTVGQKRVTCHVILCTKCSGNFHDTTRPHALVYFYLLFHALLEQVLRFKSEYGEDDRARVDRGEGVARRDEVHVEHAVLVLGVVAAEADDGAEREAVGVEHLVGRVQPHGRSEQLVHLRAERSSNMEFHRCWGLP